VNDKKDIPISRAIGQFFGHLWHSIRKTTIEEVEFRDDPNG